MAGKKLTVLLVDDSRTALLQIENAVAASEDAEVVGAASDGAKAIQRASELKPDFVIMDIVIPDIDGLAALRICFRPSSPRYGSRCSLRWAEWRPRRKRHFGWVRCRTRQTSR